MPKKDLTPPTLGPTGRCVADAVRQRREDLGMTYTALERLLIELGHRIPVQGLRRIETRARRVDVDDLMALAVALETSPTTLLTHQGQDIAEGSQIATAVPDNVGVLELTEWIRGETTLVDLDRLVFHTQLIARLDAELDQVDEEVADLRRQLLDRPRDAALLAQVHLKEERSVELDKALVEAKRNLDDLQASQI